jgi:hypothetical protein
MAKQRKTSEKAASAASKVLRDDRTGKDSKTAAASALSQAAPKKPTPKKPLPNAPSKNEGKKSGGGRGNNTGRK